MRLFCSAALCILTWNVQANVIQYFAGISYNNASELFKTQKYQFILGDTSSYADLKFAGSVLNFNTFQYDSGVNHSRTITNMPYGRIAKRFNKKTVFAVDVTQPFNSNLDWGNNAFTRFAVTQNFLRDWDISPKLAYSVNKHFKIGGGLNLNYIFENEINWAYPISQTSSDVLRNPTSSFGLGYNLGATLILNKNNFLGLTYYSRIIQHTNGVSTLWKYTNPNLNLSFSMPATTILSYTHIFNKRWLMNLQGFISEWNVNKFVRVYNTAVPPPDQNFVFEMDFTRSIAYMAVLRNQCNKKLGLSLLGMIDDGPERDHLRTIVFPSDVQYVIGLAADYRISKHGTLELLYGHVFSWPSIQNHVLVNNQSIPFTTGSVVINADVLDLRIKVEI